MIEEGAESAGRKDEVPELSRIFALSASLGLLPQDLLGLIEPAPADGNAAASEGLLELEVPGLVSLEGISVGGNATASPDDLETFVVGFFAGKLLDAELEGNGGNELLLEGELKSGKGGRSGIEEGEFAEIKLGTELTELVAGGIAGAEFPKNAEPKGDPLLGALVFEPNGVAGALPKASKPLELPADC